MGPTNPFVKEHFQPVNEFLDKIAVRYELYSALTHPRVYHKDQLSKLTMTLLSRPVTYKQLYISFIRNSSSVPTRYHKHLLRRRPAQRYQNILTSTDNNSSFRQSKLFKKLSKCRQLLRTKAHSLQFLTESNPSQTRQPQWTSHPLPYGSLHSITSSLMLRSPVDLRRLYWRFNEK
jgi:hypothetical protein